MEDTAINELFDLIANQNMPDSGFEEIYLGSFINVGELDDTVLDRLVEESRNLQKITIKLMAAEENSDHNREELTSLSNKILEVRPPLTQLDLE